MADKTFEERKKIIYDFINDPRYVPMKQKELAIILQVEKKDREEFPLLLEAALSRLAAELPRRPDLLPVLDRLVPIRAACEFPVSPGHLSGWIAAAL